MAKSLRKEKLLITKFYNIAATELTIVTLVTCFTCESKSYKALAVCTATFSGLINFSIIHIFELFYEYYF